MAKVKTQYTCQNCGQTSPKWLGKCPSCNEWNTFQEEIVPGKSSASTLPGSTATITHSVKPLSSVSQQTHSRIRINDQELTRVLGGGIVPGSLVLFGGEPGIGKSTLMLQIALQNPHLKIFYVAGEESEEQIRLRADRLGIPNDNILIYTGTDTLSICQQAESHTPDLLIIDSIQTISTPNLESAPGTVSQIRECTNEIMRFAKKKMLPTFLIGHITKDGSLAGPKVLEHMVDTVLSFEGDRNYNFRIVRANKNRFGSTNELGIYEMTSKGLIEVDNPSRILISKQEESLSGISIASIMEGQRPLMVEVQALVSSAAYGTPQRQASGFDTRRLNMLLAILEKRCGFRLGAMDVFLNITGGIKVDERAIDLAVITSVLSSNQNIPIAHNTCFTAEVGLSGEIRPVQYADKRIKEAEKLGYKHIVLSYYNEINVKSSKIQIHRVKKIEDVFHMLFG